MIRFVIVVAMTGLAACSGGGEPTGSLNQPLAGPVAAYGFEEGSGSTTSDSSGNAFTGALSSASWVPGKFGNALQFSGAANSWVTIQDAPALRLATGMTVEAWVKPTTPINNYPSIVNKQRTGEFAYALYANANDGKPNINYTYGTGPTEVNLNAGTKPASNVWTHLAGTFNGSTLKLYVNGVQLASLNDSHAIDSTSTGVLRIGGDSIWSGEQFTGLIDEVRIYNRALSQTEIQTDMTTPIVAARDAATVQDATIDQDAGTFAEVGVDAREAAVDAMGDQIAVEAEASEAQTVLSDAARELDASSADDAPLAEAGVRPTYPLKRSPGKRYLVDQNDLPFFMSGDAGWSVITTLSLADATTYLNDRASKGFNTIWMGLIDNEFAAAPSGANAYGNLPFLKALDGTAYADARAQRPDFSTPNESYFAYVDQIVGLAAARGMLVLLSPAWLGWGGGGPGTEGYYNAMTQMSAATLQGYGQYLGARYARFPNIVWHHAGDYNPPNKAVVENIVAGIKLADQVHLNTVDTTDGTSPMDFWASETWLDVDNVYSDTMLGFASVYSKTQIEYQRANWKPLFMKEGAYEGEHASSHELIRSQAYLGILGGGFGEIFGNNPIWFFGSGWQSALGSQGSTDMARLTALFTARRWDKLVPDFGHLLATNPGESWTARAADGSWAVAYRNGGTATYDLGTFSIASIRVSWFDPTTGTYSPISVSPVGNHGTLTLPTPGANAAGDADWLLVFE